LEEILAMFAIAPVARQRPFARATALVIGLVFAVSACSGGASPPPAPTTASSAPGGSAPAPSTPAEEACMPASFPTGQVNITVWTGTDTTAQELGRELVAEYQQLHPNVHIDNIPTGTTEGLPKMLIAFPAGEGNPTAGIFYEPYIQTFLGPGYLEPANPEAMCAADSQEIVDRYLPDSISPLIHDDTLYFLPVQRNSYSLLINNEKFTAAGLSLEEDIPTTWDELAALQPTLKKEEGGRVTQKGFEFRYTSGDQWFSSQFIGMVYQEGGDILDDSGKAVFNTPAALAALENWTQNVVAPTITNNSPPSPYQDFADGLDVMAFGGPNALKFATIINPALEGNVTVAPMLRGSEPDVSGMAYGFHYGVNKNATPEEKFVAWNFINYFVDSADRWWQRTGQLQPKKTLTQAEGSVGLDVFLEDLQNARPLPSTDTYGAVQVAIKNAIQRVVLEGVDPAASLDAAQQEYDAATG
jgi:multiple sugar transport system substrate-binding protein